MAHGVGCFRKESPGRKKQALLALASKQFVLVHNIANHGHDRYRPHTNAESEAGSVEQ